MYIITFFIIYLENSVYKNLKFDFYFCLLYFFSLRSARLFSHKAKVSSWLSLGRSLVLFLVRTKSSFSLRCGSAY